jgi:hypothetical protein
MSEADLTGAIQFIQLNSSKKKSVANLTGTNPPNSHPVARNSHPATRTAQHVTRNPHPLSFFFYRLEFNTHQGC